MLPRLSSLLLAAFAAFAVWWLVPGSAIDRAWFAFSTFAIPDATVASAGNGTWGNPYRLKVENIKLSDSGGEGPTEILITEDPDLIFQSTPPSPVDFAIILKNLRRMNRDSIAIATPLFWSGPETIANVALERQLGEVPKLVTSAPLSRGPQDSALPPAFRRASIPVSKVRGDTELLPKVNRIPVPSIMLGEKKALAGFTILESEEAGEHPYLMAMWGDRIVFSFHLLAALEHLGITPDSIDIHLGEAIRIGLEGHRIAIDRFGRLKSMPPPSTRSSFEISAESLINADPDLLSSNSFKPIVIRDGVPSSEPALTNFSDSLGEMIAFLSGSNKTFSVKRFPRLSSEVEILFLAALLSLIFAIQNHFSGHTSRFTLLSLCLFLIVLHFILVNLTETWPPTLPALAAIITTIACVRKKKNRRRRRFFKVFSSKKSSARLNQSHNLAE
jgi:hypothetical protein